MEQPAAFGFVLLQQRLIAEINTQACLYRHQKSGALLLSLQNEDENKAFAITFRTPPSDSTGVPHIMEHSVLCGSRRYPVKEPFIELAKGSLKTFLNAMTGDIATYYPVASTNATDFYNLIGVYLDCVFYPRLLPETFAQEGWHYELLRPDDPLLYKGVVFNEMKGYYASPDMLLSTHVQSSLFPDNAYGEDAGGDPQHIPDLTYQDFLRFHREHYHPSNGFIVMAGDDDPEERLRFLNAWLQDFDARPPVPLPPLQPAFNAPRQAIHSYPVEPDSAEPPRAHVSVNWMLPPTTDPELVLTVQILSHILIATPASPVRKALLDSGLGERVGGGDHEARQPFFQIALKGTEAGAAQEIEDLILRTLQQQVEQGLDAATVTASMNTVEFLLRENNTGSLPRGLSLMFTATEMWLREGDPIAALAFLEPLEALKARLATGERVFEKLIQELLLDNPHRTRELLVPSEAEAERLRQEERARLEAVRTTLPSPRLEALVTQTERLQQLQETPDPPEALALIPRLRLQDLDPQQKTIPLELRQVGGQPLLWHDLPTNGVLYLDVGFNLEGLPPRLLPYLALLGRGFTHLGTTRTDYVTLSQRIGQQTGGIWHSPLCASVRNDTADPGVTSWLFLRAKALTHQTSLLGDLLEEMLSLVRLDDRERFRQLVLEEKARLTSSLRMGGSGYAFTRLQSGYNRSGWFTEQTSGVTYAAFIRQLADRLETGWAAVLNDLQELHHLLVQRRQVMFNLTGNSDLLQRAQPVLEQLVASLPENGAQTPAGWHQAAQQGIAAGLAREALTLPTQVNACAQAMNLYALGYVPGGSIFPVTNYLRTTWMWEQVRTKGGAYGAHLNFNLRSGLFTCMSSQDPNLLATLETFGQTAEFLRKLDLCPGELNGAIIGAISDLDFYLLPDARGWVSLRRYLTGQTDQQLQQLRQEILTTTVADFHRLAEPLQQLASAGRTVLITSPERAAAELAGWPTTAVI